MTLTTLHSSKGLEFPVVFIVDINEGTIPHRKATLEADLEEERRMFYVGMTRARERLHLYYAKERYGKNRYFQVLDELRANRPLKFLLTVAKRMQMSAFPFQNVENRQMKEISHLPVFSL
ncbi:MAG: 3'-5' exonuclease [Blautia sp.]